jgi:hypothetical protein
MHASEAKAQVADDSQGTQAAAEDASGDEQPTFVLPEQSTVALPPRTLKRPSVRAARAATPAPHRPQAASDGPERPPAHAPESAAWATIPRVVGWAERFLAARPWVWVLALLIVVCILAFVSRQVGG